MEFFGFDGIPSLFNRTISDYPFQSRRSKIKINLQRLFHCREIGIHYGHVKKKYEMYCNKE
jgi:hypothetical protein